MRLEAITVQNFLGVADFRHKLSSRLLVITGENGAGKSSLQDALRFALLDESARGMTRASDRPKLITDGASAGFVKVTVDGYELRRNIGSGKADGDNPFPITPALGLCLDAPRFASMPEAERRRLLFELAGVQMNRETVAAQLMAAEIPAEVVEKVLPQLRQGFPAAAEYAKEQASQARGAWRAITGETYGHIKAAGWTASMPAETPELEDIADAKEKIAAAERQVQQALEAKGRVSGSVSPEKRAELQALYDTLPECGAREEAAQRAYDAAKREEEELGREARGHSGIGFACPGCNAKLVLDGEAVRLAPTGKVSPPKAHAVLAKAKAKREAAQGALTAARTDYAMVRAAGQTLEALPSPSPEDIALAEKYDESRHHLQLCRDALRAVEQASADAKTAEGKTIGAKLEYLRERAWVAAEDKLGPDGIPATLLTQALDPINDALAGQAMAAGFRPACIERDLTLTYGGRPYALCSESEQWRANALFAVVVAVLSGYRIVTLDRFDVLDPGTRPEAIDWLESLTQGEDPAIETVVVTATLKNKPDLGSGVDVVWMEKKAASPQRVAA
jgi:energy-coupling factor transporter ATP-binding protein EcfA2